MHMVKYERSQQLEWGGNVWDGGKCVCVAGSLCVQKTGSQNTSVADLLVIKKSKALGLSTHHDSSA